MKLPSDILFLKKYLDCEIIVESMVVEISWDYLQYIFVI